MSNLYFKKITKYVKNVPYFTWNRKIACIGIQIRFFGIFCEISLCTPSVSQALQVCKSPRTAGLEKQQWSVRLEKQYWSAGLEKQQWSAGLEKQQWSAGLEKQNWAKVQSDIPWNVSKSPIWIQILYRQFYCLEYTREHF